MAFYRSPDLMTAASFLALSTIPLLAAWTWFLYKSGEVMVCDLRELRFAQRSIWAPWKRHRFDSKLVRQLHKTIRGGSKSRTYSVLTFEYDSRTFDMLEEVSNTDADQILLACRSLGVDVLIAHDPGAAMLRDIEDRGWFVNPLKPDKH